MKANELMVGDWVLWKGKPVQVASVSGIKYSFGHIDVTLAHCNDEKLLETHDIKSIQPIPLTPEILEKNGFAHYEEDEESFHDEDCVFIKQNLGGYGVCLDKNRTVSGLFHYVHELQHALRLCGIDKTIEL